MTWSPAIWIIVLKIRTKLKIFTNLIFLPLSLPTLILKKNLHLLSDFGEIVYEKSLFECWKLRQKWKKIQMGVPLPKNLKSSIIWFLWNFIWNIFIWILVGNNRKNGNFYKGGEGFPLPSEILKSSFIILFWWNFVWNPFIKQYHHSRTTAGSCTTLVN